MEDAMRTTLLAALRDVVELCERMVYVPTVEQRPLQPLAMGHYENVVQVRPARELAQ